MLHKRADGFELAVSGGVVKGSVADGVSGGEGVVGGSAANAGGGDDPPDPRNGV